MNLVTRLVAGVLAGVFALAAVSKLADRPTTTRSFEDLGLRWPAPLGMIVPLVELITAVVLVLWPPVGAAAALAMLCAFSVILVRVVRGGLPLGCACFGAWSARGDTGVGWASVVRNAVLAAMATLVVVVG
ncbi:MAG: hypothetical protein IT195_02115 [Microthrixaceae bacterium]|nr:hypothetical protein [Microthrixaceae bacterium]